MQKILVYLLLLWQKHEGAFVAAFLAVIGGALVGVFTSWVTYSYNRREEKLKRKETYCGFLSAIASELLWHEQLSMRLKNEIKELRNISIEKQELVSTPTKHFQVSFLNECRIKLTEFQTFNIGLLSYLSAHINAILWLNANLDLNQLRDVKTLFNRESLYVVAINKYFNDLIDDHTKVERSRETLSNQIKKEIKIVSQGRRDFDKELDKKMSA